VSGFFDAVKEEIGNTLKRPGRLRHALNPSRLSGYLGYLWWRLRMPERWQEEGAFETRRYKDYPTYLKHQSQKLASLDLADYDRRYSAILAEGRFLWNALLNHDANPATLVVLGRRQHEQHQRVA